MKRRGAGSLCSLLDATFVTEALDNDPYHREVLLYIGFLNTAETLVSDPDIMWTGRIEQMSLVAGETNAISITAQSSLSIFRETANVLWNDVAHQERNPGDLYFQYQAQVVDARPEWLGPVSTGVNYSEGPRGTPSNPGADVFLR